MSLVYYRDLEKEITEAPEPHTLPKGSEVKARIISIREGISDKNGCAWYMLTFDVPSDPLALEFNDFFWNLATREKLDEKSVQRSLSKFKLFAQAFGIDYSKPFDLEDFIGHEGWMILGIQKSDEFGEQNTVSKYVAGR